MKLISKYRDYYDFFARDRSLSDQAYVWERKPQTVKIDFAIPRMQFTDGGLYARRGGAWRRDGPEMTCFIVWFCGIPVPTVMVRRTSQDYRTTTDLFYRIEDIPADAVGEKPKKPSKRYPNLYERVEAMFSLGNDDKTSGWRRNPFEAVSLAGRVLPKIDLLEMHRKVKSPIFCHPFYISGYEGKDSLDFSAIKNPSYPAVLINPRLATLEFWKKFNAFTAFQMLERFVSNELAPRDLKRDKSIVDHPIPDVLKAQSHGFDKHSFRKEPSSDKPRR